MTLLWPVFVACHFCGRFCGVCVLLFFRCALVARVRACLSLPLALFCVFASLCVFCSPVAVFFCLFRVSPDWVATNSFCCMFLSLLRHSGFLPLCPWQIFFVVVSVGLLPFRCCFAVLGMVRRKSGWRICVLPFGCGVLCFGVFDFNSHATACVHVEGFLDNGLFSCKDRP